MLLKKLKIGVGAVTMAFLGAGAGGLTVGDLARGAQREAKDAKPQVAVTAGTPRLLIEHKSPVVHVTWSPDGKQVATCTSAGTIHITDSATGKQIQSFQA